MFGLIDYLIFGLTLSLSASIGIYFGCFGTKQKSASEYLYGNRKMNAIPVGLSLYSSAVSAVTIVGIPSEVYAFGTQYMLAPLGGILSLFLVWKLILPVFCGNISFSVPYEYFELRFNKGVRTLLSVIYIIHTLLYMPVVLYATTLSFSTASGIPLIYCTTIIGGVCTFYTMLGGFKSVIWTDTIQATLMLCSCIFLMFIGLKKAGGFQEVWEQSKDGKRIEFFNMDPNPFVRTSFWTTTLGMAVFCAAHYGCSAGALQRYMSLSTEKDARIGTSINIVGYAILSTVCGFIGLCIYVYYRSCDPLLNKEIKNANAILSFYITDILGHVNGFNGFFIAGLLCAGLSTISAELNTVSGIIYYDFLKKLMKKTKIKESRSTLIMKILVVVNGLFYIVCAPLLANATYLFQLSLTIMSFTYGAKLGMTLLGTSFPKANAIGVICGAITSILISAWVSLGGLYYDHSSTYALETFNNNCTGRNITLLPPTTSVPIGQRNDEEPFIIYRLSHMYYTLFGTIVTIIVGLIVSYATNRNETSKIDQRLLIPFLRETQLEECCTSKEEPK